MYVCMFDKGSLNFYQNDAKFLREVEVNPGRVINKFERNRLKIDYKNSEKQAKLLLVAKIAKCLFTFSTLL